MKSKINLIILFYSFFVLPSCNRSSSPVIPTLPSCNTASNVYIEVTFNGHTLRTNAYEYLGIKYGTYSFFQPSISDPGSTILSLTSVYNCPFGGVLGSMSCSLMLTKVGSPTIGIYNDFLTASQSGLNYIADWSSGTAKKYDIKESSLAVNITSITTDYITGTFTGTLKDATTEYPATGSFNVLRNN